MKQTLTAQLKEAMFQAEQNYIYHRDALKQLAPNGVNFCYMEVNAQQATAYTRYKEAEAVLYTLQNFFEMRVAGLNEHNTIVKEIISEYENAESQPAIEAAYKKYCSLYTLK